MKIFSLVLGFIIAIFAIIYIILLILTKKPFKYFFLNMILGAWCYAIVELTSFYTGLHIPLNYFTALITGILGVPGVALIEIMKYIIFV